MKDNKNEKMYRVCVIYLENFENQHQSVKIKLVYYFLIFLQLFFLIEDFGIFNKRPHLFSAHI